MRDRSEPAPGSVRHMVASHSPEASGGIIRAFCSSVPKCRIVRIAPGTRPATICMEWQAPEKISLTMPRPRRPCLPAEFLRRGQTGPALLDIGFVGLRNRPAGARGRSPAVRPEYRPARPAARSRLPRRPRNGRRSHRETPRPSPQCASHPRSRSAKRGYRRREPQTVSFLSPQIRIVAGSVS
jgi:hypothetical protein